ncbi:thermonuclease family protein [Paracoccus aerius]|uniref:Thermonuclease family protein n=1 Tax=Paracoccus aerius TaxID=1915382 RepID=A0ABS1SA67_9RHOB|nr:thermonuclease family protein [Paracoccus aerius]MBL3674396.1 thermonuclease family protein [Paracoccus aerius]
MGLTVAEAFILLSFILLLLFTWWQIDTEKRSLRLADSLGEMSDADKASIIAGLSDGTFAMARALRAAGLGAQDQAAIEDTERYSRFMREEDLKRLMSGAVELEPGTRLKLSEVVEVTPEMRLRATLEDLLRPSDAVSQASERLAQAAAAEEGLIGMLERELGDKIRAAGGEITSDGTIILPQNILFDVGEDRIRDPKMLRQFCAPWVRTLQSSGLDISDLKIEGHASSEGQPGQSPEAAYLYNLGLSQRRAQNALEVCLSGLESRSLLDWARGRLSSTGYSSARLVANEDGSENREGSRRVEFSMALNREKLLDDIREDLKGEMEPGRSQSGMVRPGAPASQAGAESKLANPEDDPVPPEQGTRGVPRIIDGDTLVIGERHWRISGIDAPEAAQTCQTRDGSSFACGSTATEMMVRLIGDAEIWCEEIEKDRYSRSVGTCYAGDIDLGREMVKVGMARAYLQYSDAYQVEEQVAKTERRGLWAGAFQDPAEYRREN